MIGANSNLFGAIMGFVLPSIFVSTYDANISYSDEEKKNFEDQIFNMLLTIAIFSTVALVLVITTFREKPPTPASLSKGETSQNKSIL